MASMCKFIKLLIFSSFLLPPLALAEVGTIEKVGFGPSVKVIRKGSSVRLKEGDELQSGDEIATDATTAVDIRLEDETLIRVGVNSAYKVQEDSKMHALVHRLLAGVVRVLVQPTNRDHTDPKIKFRMYTEEGTIGVRGTEFVVTRQGGKTQLKGLDGEVLFGPANTDFSSTESFELIKRGFESSVAAGAKAVTKPEKFDLQKYLENLNAKANAFFGAVASVEGRGGKPARYLRTANKATTVAAQEAASVGEASQPAIPKVEPAKPKVASVDKQVLQDQLVQAVLNNNMAGVHEAMGLGAKIDGKSATGLTPLEAAMASAKTKDEKEMFSTLMELGPDVEALDGEGLTPLMFAAEYHLNMEYVTILVDLGGANPDFKGKNGKTALDYATSVNHIEMVKYLRSQKSVDDYEKGVEFQKSLGHGRAKKK